MSMDLDVILLVGLIVIFIVSFCGLLRKIKETYAQESLIADRLNQTSSSGLGPIMISGVYLNAAFTSEMMRSSLDSSSGVFPAAPPPYSEYYVEPPPSYDDVLKQQSSITIPVQQEPIRN